MSAIIQGRWRIWLAGVLLGLGTMGCKGLLGSQGPPADPLFIGHKPQESKAEKSAPIVLAFAEPEVPPNPTLALAKTSSTGLPVAGKDQPRGTVPGLLTGRPNSPDHSKLPPKPGPGLEP